MNTDEPIILMKDNAPLAVYRSGWIGRVNKDGKITRVTKGSDRGKGYLYISHQRKPYYVHRLVAEAFIPNPENKPTVDHINRNRGDNRVENLRWVTQLEQFANIDKANRTYNHEPFLVAYPGCDRKTAKRLWIRAYRKWQKENAQCDDCAS